MHWLFLAALLALAAVCGVIRAAPAPREDAENRPPAGEDARTRARRCLERLAGAVEALRAVMDHPQLGGPGFLSVQFPVLAGGRADVSAQFPNISEALYRRVVRRELDRAALLADGVPEALFAYNPEFSTESGGVVLLTAEVCGLEAELAEALASRRDRAGALAALSEALERRCPGLSVRPLGAELLLTPVREAAPAGR